MSKQYFVGYRVIGSEIPHKVHAIIPPLEVEGSEDEKILKEQIRKGIALRAEIPEESVDLLCFDEYKK